MAKQIHGREHRFGGSDIPIHAAGTITGWRLLADQTGSAVVDVWKTTYAGFPPGTANAITGSDLPTLGSQQKAESTALTGWTRTISEGDVMRLNVNSAGTVTRLTLSLSIHA